MKQEEGLSAVTHDLEETMGGKRQRVHEHK